MCSFCIQPTFGFAVLPTRSGVGAFYWISPASTSALASSHSGVGAFCCDFTRALFLTNCATKSQCWDVLCLVLLFKCFFSCIAGRVRDMVGQLLEIRLELKANWMQKFPWKRTKNNKKTKPQNTPQQAQNNNTTAREIRKTK